MLDVLIVDDDADIREMLAFTLAGQGLLTRQAADGSEALAALACGATPACVVLDLMMPGVDGFEVLRRMRDDGLGAGAKVLVLSCRDDEAALVRAWELGAAGYLTKPMDPDVLVGRIKELVAASAA